MPAAAAIPAPMAFVKVNAVEHIVVGPLRGVVVCLLGANRAPVCTCKTVRCA